MYIVGKEFGDTSQKNLRLELDERTFYRLSNVGCLSTALRDKLYESLRRVTCCAKVKIIGRQVA